jgi:hypothetical protein
MTISNSIKVKARRAEVAKPVGLLRLFVFVNEMTVFKIYVLKQKAVLVSSNSPQSFVQVTVANDNHRRLWLVRMW